MAGPSIDDPELTLRELFEWWPDTVAVFMRHRMVCVGCYITPFHTVADACQEYRLDEAAFRTELRRVAAAKGARRKRN